MLSSTEIPGFSWIQNFPGSRILLEIRWTRVGIYTDDSEQESHITQEVKNSPRVKKLSQQKKYITKGNFLKLL